MQTYLFCLDSDFRYDDLTCHCTGSSGSRGGKEDLYFGGSHTSQKVPVVGGNDSFTVGQNTAGTAAAEATARMGDHGTGFCQNGKGTVLKRLLIDLAAGRSDNQFYKRSHFFAFQDRSCLLQIFQTTVGTGADEDLVNRSTGTKSSAL